MDYGLIGARLGHSYSKPIHEQVGGYRYELHPLPTEADARAFLEARQFRAVNVTIPYKQLVLAYCDEVEPTAAAIGAVNTLVNRGGRLYGYNTDYAGFQYLAAAHGIRFAGKNVLILGTGGTHNTVAAACKNGGAASVLTAGRTGRNHSLTYAQAADHPEVEIIINTTPVGMYPETGVCLVDLKAFPQLEAVVDVVYNPFRTELLLQAEERGVTAVCGFEMLVAQAVYAAEKFTGKHYPVSEIEATHARLKKEISNLSLIGMPGCGKSSIGRVLAQRLGKTYVDIDEKIEQGLGMPIPDVFAQSGEALFRRYEAEAVAAYSKGNRQVLACGGGVIKTPGNARMLRQNGPVLWIRRPVEQLPTDGRPLSQGHDLQAMETERGPLYRAAATDVLENTATLADAVNRAAAWFNEQY
ncbi:MAG: shikimate kinase [Gemmiger sp.]|nr:shikimate kinase [Gemmiger sp.]